MAPYNFHFLGKLCKRVVCLAFSISLKLVCSADPLGSISGHVTKSFFCQRIPSGFVPIAALLSHWSLLSVWIFPCVANTTQVLPLPPQLLCFQGGLWPGFHGDAVPTCDLGSSLNFHGTSCLFALVEVILYDSPSPAPSPPQPLIGSWRTNTVGCWHLYHFPVSVGGSTDTCRMEKEVNRNGTWNDSVL